MEKFQFINETVNSEIAMDQWLTAHRESVEAHLARDGKHNIRALIEYIDLLEKTVSGTYSTKAFLNYKRTYLPNWQRCRELVKIGKWYEADESK
jgi:hypothetical protein